MHLCGSLQFPKWGGNITVFISFCFRYDSVAMPTCPLVYTVMTRAVRLIKIELQSWFETLRFANRKACDVDAILLCSRAYAWLPALSGSLTTNRVSALPFSPISTALVNSLNAHHLTFTFTYLADAFIKSDLHCIQVSTFLSALSA